MIAEQIKLTPREREILTLKMDGYSTKEISVRLKVSMTTVKGHSSRMIRKLECRNMTQFCCKVLKGGLWNNT